MLTPEAMFDADDEAVPGVYTVSFIVPEDALYDGVLGIRHDALEVSLTVEVLPEPPLTAAQTTAIRSSR